MKKNLQAGFSLIELMVVVAIIGILAAIAVPNFQNFIVKSKQSEAKANLGALYSCEAAFFAEWNRYFADFRDIGLSPEGVLNYRFGFTAAGAVTAPPAPYSGVTAAGAAATFISTNSCGTAPLLKCSHGGSVAAIPAAATGVTAVGAFIAGAGANLDSDAQLDQWQIDENKVLAISGGNNDLL